MKELENLKELYLDEIKRINKKGELTPTDGEAACKALDAIEKIDKICESCGEMENGYSERMHPKYSMTGRYSQRGMPELYHERDYGYSEGYPMMQHPYYDDGRYSERRGRSAMTGRYISRHGGSTVDGMIGKLESMKADAPNHETMMAIDNVISKLENY